VHSSQLGNSAADFPGIHVPGDSVSQDEDCLSLDIAGNYWLGALGWLVGGSMETLTNRSRDGEVQTNAGLYDQALLLQFLSQFIDKVGGDPSQISA